MAATFPHDYRIGFPDKRIYIARNHQWAFAAWALGRRTGAFAHPVTLLHVDAHLDDTWDGILAQGLNEMRTPEDCLSVAGRLEIDNFIWAGFACGAIDRIVYVCPREEDPSDPFDLSDWPLNGEQLLPLKMLLARKAYQGERLESIAELRRLAACPDRLEQLLAAPNAVVLDLDLDVFRSYTEAEIRADLAFLKSFYAYDMITVALSPPFCGGEERCASIYRQFLDIFELDPAEAVDW
ncbi:UPF0489 family protein [Cohnella nanjingensis]|uniref:UPF0489 family protein n=1 Tax=Cohnella nanjingensis TaxID=1387779 RepID=A0A7X0VG70_9BACL|nr:UPF0489 family protein [Cohnella nanjingensis]MBB6672802.1 UPF0489 family protein [Cohnella nanjingensis]